MYSHVLNYRTWSLCIILCGSLFLKFFFNNWKTICYRKSERIWSHKSLVLVTRCNLFSIQCRSTLTSRIHIRLAHVTRFKVHFNKITLTCVNIKSLGIWKFLHKTEAHQCCLTGYRVSQCIIFFTNLLSWLFPGLNLKNFSTRTSLQSKLRIVSIICKVISRVLL